MSQGVTLQQLAAALANYRKRLQSKQLEVDALNRIRTSASGVIRMMTMAGDDSDRADRNMFENAVNDFLTAQINWLLIDVQEFELQIKALEAQQSGIVLATPAPGRR